MDTLIMKMCLPFSAGPEGLKELEKITERFEEKLYTDATKPVGLSTKNSSDDDDDQTYECRIVL